MVDHSDADQIPTVRSASDFLEVIPFKVVKCQSMLCTVTFRFVPNLLFDPKNAGFSIIHPSLSSMAN